jgi:hypothetical protein
LPEAEEAAGKAREVERFAYKIVSAAEEGSPRAVEAKNILRQAIGLRRQLENWRNHGE